MQGKQFQLKSALLAIVEVGGRHETIYVPASEVVTVTAGPLQGTRLVSVQWGEQVVLMFTEDLQMRAKLIQS